MPALEQSAVRCALATAAIVLFAAPAQALGAKAEVVDGELRVTAAAGEISDAGIARQGGTNDFLLRDYRTKLALGAGCSPAPEERTVCESDGVTRITVSLGDRNDWLAVGAGLPPLTFSGGKGRDQISYEGRTNVLLDGIANDGFDGLDNIADDVEIIEGSGVADTIVGGKHGLLIDLGEGNDTVTGGSGNDRIKAASVEGSGESTGDFSGEGTDTVACGAGKDQVFVGGGDRIAKDCEVVGRLTGQRFVYTGSARADIINIDEYVTGIVHGRGGNDLIRANSLQPASGDVLVNDLAGAGDGNGSLNGDAGNDTIYGAPDAVDSFSGGPGRDLIVARDHSGERERVRCGPGRDRVIANRKDRVARDCERVSRR